MAIAIGIIFIIKGLIQINDPIVTATSITLFWQPVKVASIFEISISAEGYPRRRTYVPSNQAKYELQGLLPDTAYNVSLWLVALLKGTSASINGPFLVYNATITTRQLGMCQCYHQILLFQTLDSFEVGISVKQTWLILEWTAPPETGLYVYSNVLVEYVSPTIRTSSETSTLAGFLRTKVSSKDAWSYFNVSLQFNGYTGKRLTTIFRGRVITREQGKPIIYVHP